MSNDTIDAFIARGGTIKVLPYQAHPKKELNARPTVVGPANILSLEDAGIMFGERSKRKIVKSRSSSNRSKDLIQMRDILTKVQATLAKKGMKISF